MAEPVGQRLPGVARIRKSGEIREVFRRGVRKRTPLLDVYTLSPASGTSVACRARARIGWVVPKLGNGIVQRNRLKRRLREIGRKRVLGRLHEAGLGLDILVRVRRRAYRTTYQQLESEWMSVVEAVCSDA